MAAATNNTETYRLKQWEGIIQDRQASGLSVKEFCEKAGCHPNKYYYWQRKLRDRATVETLPNNRACEIAPSGWAVCNITDPPCLNSSLSIQIGQYRINISGAVDEIQLETVCRVLVRLC